MLGIIEITNYISTWIYDYKLLEISIKKMGEKKLLRWEFYEVNERQDWLQARKVANSSCRVCLWHVAIVYLQFSTMVTMVGGWIIERVNILEPTRLRWIIEKRTWKFLFNYKVLFQVRAFRVAFDVLSIEN